MFKWTCPSCERTFDGPQSIGSHVRHCDVTQAEVFWSRVNKGAPNGCWEWTGYRQKFGHGSLARVTGHVKPEYILAHRYAWELLVGPIPAGACLLHKCDNPPCVNPDHCYVGDRFDNARDKIERGRHALGEATKSNVLNPDKVRRIRVLRTQGLSYRAIGDEVGCKWSAARCVCIGKFWRHVV